MSSGVGHASYRVLCLDIILHGTPKYLLKCLDVRHRCGGVAVLVEWTVSTGVGMLTTGSGSAVLGSGAIRCLRSRGMAAPWIGAHR